MRALIVEDEAKMARLLRRGLVEEGYAADARIDGGAGLGLAIVDVIARAHGGSARISGDAGHTDVWLALPHE